MENTRTVRLVDVTLRDAPPCLGAAGRPPAGRADLRSTGSEGRRDLSGSASRPGKTLVEMIKSIDRMGLAIEDVHLKRPTLEDVFIELTGKKLRD